MFSGTFRLISLSQISDSDSLQVYTHVRMYMYVVNFFSWDMSCKELRIATHYKLQSAGQIL